MGRGGAGVVYLARDGVLERRVAVKVLGSGLRPESRERFRREARVVAQMDHPGIVEIYDVGEHDGALFLVMPFVGGATLRARLSDGALGVGETLELGSKLAEALEHAHARGVVHRDIKPENVLLSRAATGEARPRLTDFGLALVQDEARMTQSGALMGTIYYLSPEQISGNPVDVRTDVYALGTLLYECLAGETPFGGTPQRVLYAIAHEAPPSLRARREDVSEDLERLLLSCLAKEPGARPASALELAVALDVYRNELPRGAWQATAAMPAPRRLRSAGEERGVVGRSRELAQLGQSLQAALRGECRLVLLGGEAGIGKSRLLAELGREAAERGALVLRGRFVEQDRAFPYEGFCEAIVEYFRQRGREAALPDLSDVAGDLLSLFPVLSEVSEVRSQASTSSEGSWSLGGREGDRTYVFELLARTFARLAGGRPMALLLEDLHAAEVSIEALQYLVRRLGPTPLLVAATYRSGELHRGHPLERLLAGFANDRRLLSLVLEPLDAEDTGELLRTIAGGSVDPGIAQRLYEAAEGNPYFTLELFRSLRDAGVTSSSSALSRSSLLLGVESLPPTIQQAIERRLQRLPAPAAEVLGIAAVLGRDLDLRDLRRLAPDRATLDEALDLLLEGRFLEEDKRGRGERFSFTSAVLREVVYAGLPRGRRRALHRRHAEGVEEGQAGRLEQHYPQLAHHFAEAEVAEKAVLYGLLAGRRSLAASSPDDAALAARRVLDFLADEPGADPASEASADHVLARAARLAGSAETALAELARSVDFWERAGRGREALEAVAEAAQVAWEGRRVDEARRWAERGIALGRNLGEPELLGSCLALAANLASLRGEHLATQELLEQADRLRRPPSDRPTGTVGGELSVALPVPVVVAHPAETRLDQEVELLSNVFETLIAADEHGNPVPHLAERWDVTEGGRAIVLDLRREARFSDGSPVDAVAVKRALEESLRRAHEDASPGLTAIAGVAAFRAGESAEVAGLQVEAESRLRIELDEALPIYPALLTDPGTAIALPAAGPDALPLGTGPFVLAARGPDRLRLERNGAYWRGDAPRVDALEFHTGVGASRMVAGLRAGVFDLVRDLPAEDLDELLRDRRLRAETVETTRKNLYFVLFRDSPRLADPRVRRTLVAAARTQDLVRQALGRFGQPAQGLFPPGVLGHDPARRAPPPPTAEELEAMLSGVERPLTLVAAVNPAYQDRYQKLTRDLFARWRLLGVEVVAGTPTAEDFLAAAHDAEPFDLMVGRWVADYDDPDNFTHGLFHSRFGRWRRFCSSPELDALTEAGRTEAHPLLRVGHYRKLEALLLDSSRLLPLFHEVDVRVGGPRVRNLRLTSSPPYVNYRELERRDPPAAAAKEERGGWVEVPIGERVESLDPALVWREAHGEVVPNVFETLTRATEGAAIVPWLAAEYAAEDGARRFRFRLREGLRFHDGRAVTARDVRYSFERLLQCAQSSTRWLLGQVVGARAVLRGEVGYLEGFRILSRLELAIELERPLSFFPALLSYTSTAIVPEGAERFSGSWRDGCLGTGPFRVAAFDPGRRLDLEPNPFYWRAGLPRADGLGFAFGVPPEVVAEGLRSGRFHVARDLPLERLGAEGETLQRAQAPRLGTYFAVCNATRGPLADARLRRRLLAATPVNALVEAHLGRRALPARRLIPPGLLGHDPLGGRADEPPPTPGPPVDLAVMAHEAYLERYSTFTDAIFAGWRLAGFRPRLLEGAFEHADRGWKAERVDVGLDRWFGDYPDPDTYVHALLHSREGTVGTMCGSAELDAMMEEARVEVEPRARDRMYRRIEDLVAERALCLPLFHEHTYCFARPEVRGFSVGMGDPPVPFEELWVAG